jgi:hypothetical protein
VTDSVLSVWSPASANGRRNLNYGLRTRTWGFKHHHKDYEQPTPWLLFGYSHTAGSPRTETSTWRTGSMSVALCEISAPLYTAHAPHWPDELSAGKIIYPYRLGLTLVATADNILAGADGPLPSSASDALRHSGIGNRGVRIGFDTSALFHALGLFASPSPLPDLSQTPGSVLPEAPNIRDRSGADRSQDPELRAAVERHAVAMAKSHLRQLGWHDVKELGKPFDLVCTKDSGEEKHVEVKGTTGAGSDVEYTPNEVKHFRDCPYGADLIVVRDTQVDRATKPYGTGGGQLLHVENYAAPAHDLQATGWLGRVAGWK